jgi:BolA family transcriptional regulator, general stress-responsive regulator
MTRREQIYSVLQTTFSPLQLEVIDKTPEHHGHGNFVASGETHFEIRIQATAFEKKPMVEQHKLIYETLSSFFKEGLHSLQITVL